MSASDRAGRALFTFVILGVMVSLAACSGSTPPVTSTGPSQPMTSAATTGAAPTSATSSSSPPSGSSPSSSPPSSPPSSSPLSSTAAEPALTIGLVGPTSVGTFGHEAATSISAQVKAADGVLVSCDPGADHAQLLTCLQRMAAQDVDGWILVLETDLAELDCAAGLPAAPMITIGAPTGCEVAVVGPDDADAGRSVGRELAARAEAGAGCADSVLIVIGNPASPRSAARVDGMADGFGATCPQTPPVMIDAAGQEQAYIAVETALAAIEPGTAILIGAVEDSLALGALAAVPDSRAEQVVLAAVGADLRARCTLRQDPRWIGDAAFFADRYGPVVVSTLLAAIDGRTIPGELTVRSQFVDVESIDTYYPELECPTT